MCSLRKFIFFFLRVFYLFLERVGGEREGEKHRCARSVASRTLPIPLLPPHPLLLVRYTPGGRITQRTIVEVARLSHSSKILPMTFTLAHSRRLAFSGSSPHIHKDNNLSKRSPTASHGPLPNQPCAPFSTTTRDTNYNTS